MQDSTLNKRSFHFDNKLTEDNLRDSTLKHKLTLRKGKIDSLLMAKRIENYSPTNTLQIDITTTLIPPELHNTLDTYLRSEFNIRTACNFINSTNIKEIKTGLLLLRSYICLQIKEIEMSKRVLARNNYDLINKICTLLSYEDEQIQYEAGWCILNLTNFPEAIEKRIYYDCNLDCIAKFAQRSALTNTALLFEAIQIIANACAYNERNREYFIKNDIIDICVNVLVNPSILHIQKESTIRCLSNMSKVLIQYSDVYLGKFMDALAKIKMFFESILSLPISKTEAMVYFCRRLFLRVIETKKIEAIYLLLNNNFANALVAMYYKLKDNSDEKNNFLLMLTSFLEYEDSITQILIDDGIIPILKQSLYLYKYNNREMLKHALFALSNISAGTLSQITLMNNSDIFKDVFDIASEMYNEMIKYPKDQETSLLFYECLYVFGSAVYGGDEYIGAEIGMFSNGVIIEYVKYAVEQCKDDKLVSMLYRVIRQLIIIEENGMVDGVIKRKMIDLGYEELLKHKMNGKRISEEDVVVIRNLVKEFQEEG